MFYRKIGCCLFMVLLTLLYPLSASALSPDTHDIFFTEEEQEYLSGLSSLRVLTAPASQPYSYRNTGIAVDILNRLSDYAGVELNLIEAKSYTDALTRLEQGEADLSAVNVSQYQESAGFLPYLSAPLQIVIHKNADLTEGSELVLVQLPGFDFSYDTKYSYVNDLTVRSVQDCLDTVRRRQADIFLCDIYQLSVYSDSFAARDLTMLNLPQHEIYIGFGLHDHTDPRLISALEKVIDSFSTAELSTNLIHHEQQQDSYYEIVKFVYQNPFELLCALTSLFFVILLCLFIYYRTQTGQQQELQGYETSYRMLADTFGQAGMEYDFLNDRLTFFGSNSGLIDLPECVEEVHMALEQRSLRISLTPDDLDTMLLNNSPRRSYETELQCGMNAGDWNWFRMIYVVVCTSESHRRPIRLIGCLINIEAEHQEKERLLKIGHNDPLTNLLNRAAAENDITDLLNESAGLSVLLFMDVDNFKQFNDLHGHSCGDAVLNALSTALRETFPTDTILSRWGGDEFLLFMNHEHAHSEYVLSCLKLLQDRMLLFHYLEEVLPVTLSIGGVIASSELSFQCLFELADSALYSVKNSGRNNYRITYADSDTDLVCKDSTQVK